jgi:CHAT domain-containing protein
MREALIAANRDNDDSVLFSFHLSTREGWVWAVDGEHTAVYPVPARGVLETQVAAFVAALRHRDPAAGKMGVRLYRELFGAAAPGYLRQRRWLLELDGPLFDLPFGALTSSGNSYLAETRVVEAIPSALLFGQSQFGVPEDAVSGGGFLGIGDPIYNAADSRYRGDRRAALVPGSVPGLARLPATAAELDRCSREWGAPDSTILTGADANSAKLDAELRKQPDILHFATHVIPSPEEGAGGLIALSIDRTGKPGLMGPVEIVSRPVKAHLVILDGCNSGAGAVLPASGLLGLTRSWLGAGAHSVLATRWDVAENDAPDFMVEFYRHLHRRGARHAAEAFADTQTVLLKNPAFRDKTDFWAAYFVLGRQ